MNNKLKIRYMGFKPLQGGSRQLDFSLVIHDVIQQSISVEAPNSLFAGPDRVAIQECAAICYETLRSRIECGEEMPASISLSVADVAKHRKVETRRSRYTKVERRAGF